MLEGEEVEVSIMFIDICDFTSFAERSSARETVTYLNDFFGLVVPLLDKHHGHANKFIGDGVLGVFGAPERLSDHADRALEAACEIALAVEDRYGHELRMGIGVNSGPVSAGSVGGGGRLEFTVVGDAVNVAARVEHATRELGDRVLLTEATRCLLAREVVPLEERGAIPLKGKSEPVPIWAPDLEALDGDGFDVAVPRTAPSPFTSA
jgi:class 3 adenylate cyclase